MTKRNLLALIVPPLAVCRYGCAGCCAAPITVFWLTGIVGVIYGFMGGPAELPGISWTTVGLGFVLWGIAVAWALTTLQSVESDPHCDKNGSTFCRVVRTPPEDPDPFDEVRKFQQHH